MTGRYRFLWQKTKEGNAKLLRVYGETPEVVLPEQIAGCPLTDIGAYCFSEAEHLPRENVLETEVFLDEEGKFSDRDAGRNPLAVLAGDYPECILLPDSIKKVGNLSFYNCRKLKSLKIGKELVEIGSDAFMNCRNLRELFVSCDVRDRTGLKQILAQISWGITVVFQKRDTVFAKVFYPEYQEVYDEIAPAHIFGRNIEGEGFRARQSFKEGAIDLAQYDLIFPRACVEENEDTLLALAVARLSYPVDLKSEPRQLYETYMKEHSGHLAKKEIREKNLSSLCFLCENRYLTGAALDETVTLAAEAGWVEGAASLLKWKKEYDTKEKKDRYAFDDF